MRKILYESETAKVVSVGDIAGRDVCVTFHPYVSIESNLNVALGFGEAQLAKLGKPAVHFINLRNHWWHIEDLTECLEAAKSVVDTAKSRTGYGSSMGGYAAFRFSEPLNLDKVMAFVPQYSIDHALAPFESRWGEVRDVVKFSGEPYSVRKSAECHIIVGDERKDREHARLIQEGNPLANITVHRIGCGRHLILKDLQTRLILRDVIRALPALNIDAIRAHEKYEGQV